MGTVTLLKSCLVYGAGTVLPQAAGLRVSGPSCSNPGDPRLGWILVGRQLVPRGTAAPGCSLSPASAEGGGVRLALPTDPSPTWGWGGRGPHLPPILVWRCALLTSILLLPPGPLREVRPVSRVL